MSLVWTLLYMLSVATARLPIHILLSILGFGRSISFSKYSLFQIPYRRCISFHRISKDSSVCLVLFRERTSKTCRPWKLNSLVWLFLGGISTVGFGMGVWDGTNYQVELAYYETACLNHHSLFFLDFFSFPERIKTA